MGTNIEMYVEVYNNGRWHDGDLYKRENDSFVRMAIWEHRDYLLFGILANVRNYYGNPYIAEPRGVPEDVNYMLKNILENMESYGAVISETETNNASYFTLRELQEYHKTMPLLNEGGIISPEEQRALDENGTVPTESYINCERDGWVYRTWTTTHDPLVTLIRLLEERADRFNIANPSHIRIIFAFD